MVKEVQADKNKKNDSTTKLVELWGSAYHVIYQK
jgi:hypothetical protein